MAAATAGTGCCSTLRARLGRSRPRTGAWARAAWRGCLTARCSPPPTHCGTIRGTWRPAGSPPRSPRPPDRPQVIRAQPRRPNHCRDRGQRQRLRMGHRRRQAHRDLDRPDGGQNRLACLAPLLWASTTAAATSTCGTQRLGDDQPAPSAEEDLAGVGGRCRSGRDRDPRGLDVIDTNGQS